jgi:hypothetical protein
MPKIDQLLPRRFSIENGTSAQNYLTVTDQYRNKAGTTEPQAINDIRLRLQERAKLEETVFDEVLRLQEHADPGEEVFKEVLNGDTELQAHEQTCDIDATELPDDIPYVRKVVNDCINSNEAFLGMQRDIISEKQNRLDWYRNLILKNIYKAFKQHTLGELTADPYKSSNVENVSYAGRVMVKDMGEADEVASEYAVSTGDIILLSDIRQRNGQVAKAIEEHSFELPIPVVVGHFDGSRYPLVPWTGGLACSCPFKQQPHRITCKHEIATAWVLNGRSDGMFLPLDKGISVPARSRRFLDPHTVLNHPMIEGGV